jgi:hypothetical protein
MLLVVETAKDGGEMSVIEIRLYLYLSEYVFLHFSIAYLLFGHLLDHADEACILFLGKINFPKSSFS